MAGENFKKLTAMVALESNGTDKYKLKDSQLPQILNQINNLRYTEAYGDALLPVDVSAGTTTYTKNVGGTLQNKTSIGAGTISPMKFNPVTISLTENKFLSEGLTKIDIQRGLQSAMAAKLDFFGAQLVDANQADAYSKIKADTTNTVKVEYLAADMTTAKSSAFRSFLTAEAIKFLRTKDVAQGILRIRKDQIIVDLAPEAFDLAIQGAAVGDLTSKVVEEGIFEFSKIGGFKFRRNPYLDEGKTIGDMVAIISTNYAFKSPLGITAANIDRVLPTNDMAVYTEGNYGTGFVYQNVMKKVVLK